jgi:hypothetical protein
MFRVENAVRGGPFLVLRFLGLLINPRFQSFCAF